MKFIRQTSPYIRKNVSVKRMMFDVVIALIPLVVFAIYQSGLSALAVILVSIFTFIFFELFCMMLIKWPKGMFKKELFTKQGFNKIKDIYTINNILTPLISGLIFSLICPAGLNLYIVFIGSVFGIVVGKMVYGGLGGNIFNPAGVGRIAISVAFGASITYLNVDASIGGTPLGIGYKDLEAFKLAIDNYSLKDLFFGNVPGCMGEVNALLILIGGLYLFIRRSADIRASLAVIISFILLSVVAAFKMESNILEFTLYQVLSGGLLFGAIFMVTDPITSPTSKYGRILYGVLIGSLTSFIRLIGAYPEGMIFSIIIMNMFVPAIDKLNSVGNKYTYKHILSLVALMIVLSIILYAAF